MANTLDCRNKPVLPSALAAGLETHFAYEEQHLLPLLTGHQESTHG